MGEIIQEDLRIHSALKIVELYQVCFEDAQGCACSLLDHRCSCEYIRPRTLLPRWIKLDGPVLAHLFISRATMIHGPVATEPDGYPGQTETLVYPLYDYFF